MNVFYEESGTFKVGSVLADNMTSLHVEASHGKRSKIKASSVLLRFEAPPLYEFMHQAQQVAAELDADFLWEYCADSEEFSSHTLAADYFGHTPSPVEVAAIMILLNSAPMYFYRKGQGRYKAAPPEALRAALASQEKKRLEAELHARYKQQLSDFSLPEEFKPHLDDLLYKPNKSTVEWKALESVCTATKLSVPKLLEKCGAIASTHDYHFNLFLREHFPDGTAIDITDLEFAYVDHDDLPIADVSAFSIDDATTTEIDDAFSVSLLPMGSFRIGIHIAAPALGIAPGSLLDQIAAKRLSTVYLPGQKITMLPEKTIDSYTLSEARLCPALSLYLEVADDFTVTSTYSRIEKIKIIANLRHDALEQQFNENTLRKNLTNYPFAQELSLLWNFSRKMEIQRGKENDANNEKTDYSFFVEQERIIIQERRRGSPIDRVVSELMIFANTEWGKQLADAGIAGIYRSQNSGKVRMSLSPAPHQGLGVAQYAWSSSPMRRYVDLINQRQLIALLTDSTPPYSKDSDDLLILMRDFEQVYGVYNEFQRSMERYWCLRWLIQENIQITGAQVLKENLVKFDSIPLITRVSSLPDLSPGTQVKLEISQIDLLECTLNTKFLHKEHI